MDPTTKCNDPVINLLVAELNREMAKGPELEVGPKNWKKWHNNDFLAFSRNNPMYQPSWQNKATCNWAQNVEPDFGELAIPEAKTRLQKRCEELKNQAIQDMAMPLPQEEDPQTVKVSDFNTLLLHKQRAEEKKNELEVLSVCKNIALRILQNPTNLRWKYDVDFTDTQFTEVIKQLKDRGFEAKSEDAEDYHWPNPERTIKIWIPCDSVPNDPNVQNGFFSSRLTAHNIENLAKALWPLELTKACGAVMDSFVQTQATEISIDRIPQIMAETIASNFEQKNYDVMHYPAYGNKTIFKIKSR